MESSKTSSENLLSLEDGLGWQKKSKHPQFVSVLSYESRVTKCFIFTFILLGIALVGLVAYQLQQTIQTEDMIINSEIRMTEILEKERQNKIVSTNDAHLIIPSPEPPTPSFSEETNQDTSKSHLSEDSTEEQILEKAGVKTSQEDFLIPTTEPTTPSYSEETKQDTSKSHLSEEPTEEHILEKAGVKTSQEDFPISSSGPTTPSYSEETNQDTSKSHLSEEWNEEQFLVKLRAKTLDDLPVTDYDFLKLFEEEMRNLDGDSAESFETLHRLLERFESRTEFRNSPTIDWNAVDPIPEENRNTATAVDTEIENLTEELDEVSSSTPDYQTELSSRLELLKGLVELDEGSRIKTDIEKYDYSDDSDYDYTYGDDVYEDDDNYFSPEGYRNWPNLPSFGRSDDVKIPNESGLGLYGMESPDSVSIESVELGKKNSSDENTNELLFENMFGITNGGSDPFAEDPDWAKEMDIDQVFRKFDSDYEPLKVLDDVEDGWTPFSSLPSHLGTETPAGLTDEDLKLLQEMFEDGLYKVAENMNQLSNSDFPKLKRSISTLPVNGRLEESRSSQENSARLMTEMQQVIDEEGSALRNMISEASEPIKPALEAELNDFDKRMKVVSAHIDRLHERYLRLNEVTDDYVSKEFPASEEGTNDYGYRF